mmetsp:Transcript_24745/g.80012  ORF Transcript_24745/g.80012 Transcript_24745/m.80012 type:complete len:236 (-) Transcript_24745:816-1523(-)
MTTPPTACPRPRPPRTPATPSTPRTPLPRSAPPPRPRRRPAAPPGRPAAAKAARRAAVQRRTTSTSRLFISFTKNTPGKVDAQRRPQEHRGAGAPQRAVSFIRSSQFFFEVGDLDFGFPLVFEVAFEAAAAEVAVGEGVVEGFPPFIVIIAKGGDGGVVAGIVEEGGGVAYVVGGGREDAVFGGLVLVIREDLEHVADVDGEGEVVVVQGRRRHDVDPARLGRVVVVVVGCEVHL